MEVLALILASASCVFAAWSLPASNTKVPNERIAVSISAIKTVITPLLLCLYGTPPFLLLYDDIGYGFLELVAGKILFHHKKHGPASAALRKHFYVMHIGILQQKLDMSIA